MILAQALGEYALLAEAIAAVGALVGRVETALQDPTNATITAVVLIALAYFFFRRR
jgi:hypothetical protein